MDNRLPRTTAISMLKLQRALEDILLNLSYERSKVFVVNRLQLQKDLGWSTDTLAFVLADLDRLADLRRMPSISCLLRPHPRMIGEINWYDIFTDFNRKRSKGFGLQRFILQMVPNGNNYRVEPLPGTEEITGLTGHIDIGPLSIEDGVFERDLLIEEVYRHFWVSH